ncbi:hypothetical protein NC653_010097 [Populus alba x Populus x berolinensis]|uniref:Reverse transcriptase domain-containing protein n=1 Tax=Populus alba x Populus x berolinensis TaxID=444605 RepID=A0AAD6W4V6_9ROSI|nr:hypothetical protein NC653_010097 [Populus alba x Populus x berolinensis]
MSMCGQVALENRPASPVKIDQREYVWVGGHCGTTSNNKLSSFPPTPWVLLGDFNAILKSTDRSGGDTTWHGHLEDFGCCINESELAQLPYSDLKFTWHNGQQGRDSIMKKLDWMFGNLSFLLGWPTAHGQFLPRNLSDHSAMTMALNNPLPYHATPFKFLNLWADRGDFLEVVRLAWEARVRGNPLYCFTTKLRLLNDCTDNFQSSIPHAMESKLTVSVTNFTAAIKFFFEHNVLPKCVNATRLPLVPKVKNPMCMDDFRSVSCCNTIYKCISKIIATRLKAILPEVIGPSQSAFIQGRQISDNNILLSWVLLGDFNAILKSTDRSGGDTTWHGHLEDFGCCINESELAQLPYSDLKFTWHNGQQGRDSIMKKLDWMFGNLSFLLGWPTAHGQFLPRNLSDHRV